MNVHPDFTDPAPYFARQRRFREGELERVRRECRARAERLAALEEAFPAHG